MTHTWFHTPFNPTRVHPKTNPHMASHIIKPVRYGAIWMRGWELESSCPWPWWLSSSGEGALVRSRTSVRVRMSPWGSLSSCLGHGCLRPLVRKLNREPPWVVVWRPWEVASLRASAMELESEAWDERGREATGWEERKWDREMRGGGWPNLREKEIKPYPVLLERLLDRVSPTRVHLSCWIRIWPTPNSNLSPTRSI